MTDLFRRQRWLCDQEVADKFVCHKGGGGDGAGGDGLSGGDSQGMGGEYGDSGGGSYGGGYGDASGWGNEGYGLGAAYGYGGDSEGMGGQYGDASAWGGLAGPDAGAYGGSGSGGGGGFGSASSWGSDAMNAFAAISDYPNAHIGINENPYGLTGTPGVPGLGGIYGLPGANTEATFDDAPAVAGHAGPGFAGPGFGGTGALGGGMGGPTGGFSSGVSGGPAGGPGGGPGGASGGFSSWGEAEAAGVSGLTGGPDAVGGNGLGNVGANLGVNFADVTNPNPLSAFPNADPLSNPLGAEGVAGRFAPLSQSVTQQAYQQAQEAVIGRARMLFGGGNPPPSWESAYQAAYGTSPAQDYQAIANHNVSEAAAGRGPVANATQTLAAARGGFPGRFGNPSDPTFGRPGQSVFSDEFTEDTRLGNLAPGVDFNPTVDPSAVVDRGFNTIAAGPSNPGLAGLNPSVFQGRFNSGFSPDLMAALAAMGIPGKSGVDPSQDPMGPVAAVPSPVADPRGRLGPMGKAALPDVFRGLDLPIEVQPPVPSTPIPSPPVPSPPVVPTSQPDPRGPPAAPPSEIVFGPPTEPSGPIDEGGVPFPGVQPISPNMIPGGIGELQPGSFAPRLSPREMALLAQKFS